MTSDTQRGVLAEKQTEINISELNEGFSLYGVNQIRFLLHGRITIVEGRSGAGKTFIFEIIKALKELKDSREAYPILNNIQVIISDSEYESFVEGLGKDKGKIIIIDEADEKGTLTDKSMISYIDQDYDNVYLLVNREYDISKKYGTSLGTTPANIANLVIKDGIASLSYKYDMGGW